MSGYDTEMLREFLRGAAQVHVLHHAAEGDVHGAWLAVELRRHGYDISPGTLYPMLHRMEQSGLLVSRAEVVEGRTRRLYAATDAGTSELALLRAAVAEMLRITETPQTRSLKFPTLERGGGPDAGIHQPGWGLPDADGASHPARGAPDHVLKE